MGCGGSKEAVATGNTSAGGGKLLRRKSSVVSTGASHTSSTSSSSSSGNTGVAVKDVVKDAKAVAGEQLPKSDAAGEVTSAATDDAEKPVSVVDSKADTIVVMSVEKPAAADVVVEAKKEEEVVVVVINKDAVADDVASAPTPAAAAAGAMAVEAAAAAPEPEPEQDNKVVVVVEEDLLPESTMADEAPVEEAPKDDETKELAPLKIKDDGEETVESKILKEEEHKATSPAPTNEDGESAGRMQNTTEPVEAKPAVDEHKADEAAVVPAPSAAEAKTTTDEQLAAATVPSESARPAS